MDDSYYADGSVVQVGDIVEFNLKASHCSYCGWVANILGGVRVGECKFREGDRVQLVDREPVFKKFRGQSEQ